MCLACEEDGIWLAYLQSRGLLTPDDPAAATALFANFPVQPVPLQGEAEAAQPGDASQPADPEQPAAAKNPFICDDPTAG
jgi:hypothetical protein